MALTRGLPTGTAHFVRRAVVLVAAALAGVLSLPADASAHVTLVASSPERDAVLDAPPAEVRLRFSGMIEPRYTRVTLLGPDGAEVPVGAVVFVAGSDREFTVSVPALRLAGTYTVRWRTAGADGHVLEGAYSFTAQGAAVEGEPGVAPAAPPPPAAPDGPSADEFAADAAAGRDGIAAIAARWLQFGALILLIGGLVFRLALLPRIGLRDTMLHDLQRRTWRVVGLAALLIAAAAVLRLWVQSSALHGAADAWSWPMLSGMLRETSWGRAWLLQLVLLVVLAAGVLLARVPRDRTALLIVLPAAAGLAAIPALTGHAAMRGAPAVISDALHVLAAGAWIGTLALLLLAAVPLLVRRNPAAAGAATARMVARFSSLALGAAALLVLTGVVNALMHVSSPGQLTGTAWGRTLIVKLGLFALVLAAGFINWRVVRPALAAGAEPRRLRMSAGVELTLALLVLLATAVLTGTPRP